MLDQAMRLNFRGKQPAPQLSDAELERRHRQQEAAVARAELRAADELVRLEWLRAQARTWQHPREEER